MLPSRRGAADDPDRRHAPRLSGHHPLPTLPHQGPIKGEGFTTRPQIHASRAQVPPVDDGIPWLGFVVYPTHRLVKARSAHRRLRARLAAYHMGEISFAELDASIQGWIAHVGHADSWGLRRYLLDSLVIRPAAPRRAVAARQTRHG
jgi:hypothetical protein